MKDATTNYLRRHRKRRGFTQAEVGFLVGLKSGQIISRYEDRSLRPHLRNAFAYQIIFDVVPHKLFPGMYQEVENRVFESVVELHEALKEQKVTPLNARKQDSLRELLRRLDAQHMEV